MNTKENSEIRALTADEIEQISGGAVTLDLGWCGVSFALSESGDSIGFAGWVGNNLFSGHF